MTGADILTFAIVASLLVMSPGPNGVLIAKTVPTSGRMAGFANVAGFVAAFGVHGAFSILGISVLLLKSAIAFTIVKYLGAAYLIWIGVKSLIGVFRDQPASTKVVPARRQRTLVKAFVEGFLTNALNPKVTMFYLAAFPQFISAADGAVTAAIMLVAIHAVINCVWFAAMILLLARLTLMTKGGGFQRWLKGVTGVVFIGFGIKLASLKPGV